MWMGKAVVCVNGKGWVLMERLGVNGKAGCGWERLWCV